MIYTATRIEKRKGKLYGVLCYAKEGKYLKKYKALKAISKGAAKLELEDWRQEEESKAQREKEERIKAPLLFTYIAEFIDFRESAKIVAGSTICEYQTNFRRLKKYLPNKRLDKYSRRDFEKLQAALVSDGFSSATVRDTNGLLKNVFNKAEQDELITQSPMRFVKTPLLTKLKPGINSLDEEGAKEFLHILSNLPLSAVTMAAYIAFYTGMRRGEVCALRWSDIDLKHNVLYVRQAFSRTSDNKRYELRPPKTRKTRDCVIPNALKSKLEAWKEVCENAEYVIGHKDGATLPYLLSRKYSTLVKLLGIEGIEHRPLSFHDLRHTYATLTIAQGADVVSVASQLGHSDVSMTLNTYASVLPKAKQQLASLMDRLTE